MKKIISICCIVLIMLSISGCSFSGNEEKYQADFTGAFDTYTQIIGYAKSETEFTKQADMIYNELNSYHQLYTIYDDYEGINNIKMINDNAGIAPVTVDQKIIDLLQYGKEMYTLTEGTVNITMGAVLSIWHDYREAGVAVPSISLLQDASKHTDINDLIVDDDNNTVYLSDSEMSLDVGAIAKGFATERVAEDAYNAGFTSGILSVGGNIKAIGPPQDESKSTWGIGIQDPDNVNTVFDTVYINNESLVTSGDYERFYVVDGVKYSHIIDASTLMPAMQFRSVTVMTEDSALADALSTSLFILPYEEGLALVNSINGVNCYWIFADGMVKYTDGFAKIIKSNGATGN